MFINICHAIFQFYILFWSSRRNNGLLHMQKERLIVFFDGEFSDGYVTGIVYYATGSSCDCSANQSVRKICELITHLVSENMPSKAMPEHFCHPSMKLRDGNVFTGVCLSIHGERGGSHVTITHDALDLTVQGLSLLTSDLGPTPSPPTTEIGHTPPPY